jgi:hypothetical protein
MLHSITCEFNNGNIIQQVPFMNVFCSFKNITSWSKNDLTDWGDVCGFSPDTSRAWAYNDIAPAGAAGTPLSGSGSGLSNNRNAPYVSISTPTLNPVAAVTPLQLYNLTTIATTSSVDVRSTWNEGLFQRQSYFNYDTELTAANAFSSQKGLMLSSANSSQIFRSYVQKAENLRAFFIDAVIRLKDIADFFQKCPMLKGSTMRMYLNTNQCYFSVTQRGPSYVAATGALDAQPILGLQTQPVILGGGGTCPVIYSSAGLGQGAAALIPLVVTPAAAAIVVQVALSIVRPQFSQMAQNAVVGAAPVTSVRLYAPAYTLSPIAEQRYLSLSPTKRVVYNDIFQFSFPNQTANSPFNILVTNGIPNIRSVLVLPFLPAASNGVAVAGGQRSSTLLSPFCSTPASPDPLAILNFQIQVSGKNLFINQLQYDYETFCEQLVSSNQLNGSLTTSLASGLVSKTDFQYLYRYYYGNCSRSLPSEEGVAKSIQIQGTILNPANIGVDLMVFVEFEREITIDVRTGARIA